VQRPVRSVVRTVVERQHEPRNRPLFLDLLLRGGTAEPTVDGLIAPHGGPGGQAEPRPVRPV